MNVGRNAWRIQLAAAFVPAVPLLLLIWFAPESPRWLMKKGNYPKAFRAFCRLRKAEIQAARDMVGPRFNSVGTKLMSQFYAHCQIEEEREAFKGTTYLSRFRDIFTVPRLRRANLASWVVMISQQLCGINIMCTLRMLLCDRKRAYRRSILLVDHLLPGWVHCQAVPPRVIWLWTRQHHLCPPRDLDDRHVWQAKPPLDDLPAHGTHAVLGGVDVLCRHFEPCQSSRPRSR